MDTLKFYHWIHANTTDWGRVEYLSNDGTWKILGSLNDTNSGNWYNTYAGWSSAGTGYIHSWFDLKIVMDYAIPTQFRWAFNPYTFNNTTWEGWAVDDIEFTFPKVQIDAGVTSVIQPTGTNAYGTDIVVKCVIQNFGTDTLTNVPVKYMINGITVGGGFYPGPLVPNQSAIFTFNPLPSPLTDYKLCVYTDVNFDTYYFNDTICDQLTVIPPAFDMAVLDIISPLVQTIHGDSTTVSISIKNAGLNPVNDFLLRYTIMDTLLQVTETWHGATPLQPDEEVNYTFNQKYSFPYLGYYYLCVYSSLDNDGYLINDTICRRLESHYTFIPEYGANGFGISQNVPNPANGNTQIMCYLPHPGAVNLKMVNQLGQAMLVRKEKMTEGENLIELNTGNIPDGVYYYFIEFEGQQLGRKMVIAH
ncbi:MAG: T9SS type A sorting domain-containing protein [Bacteroidetes bacterium]|nr:T9SS type A sorting domain-containing protein [Bacteroidota bacterium]